MTKLHELLAAEKTVAAAWNTLHDTRTRALEGHEPARDHMFNYCAALVVAHFK